jgi:hypothetical protein
VQPPEQAQQEPSGLDSDFYHPGGPTPSLSAATSGHAPCAQQQPQQPGERQHAQSATAPGATDFPGFAPAGRAAPRQEPWQPWHPASGEQQQQQQQQQEPWQPAFGMPPGLSHGASTPAGASGCAAGGSGAADGLDPAGEAAEGGEGELVEVNTTSGGIRLHRQAGVLGQLPAAAPLPPRDLLHLAALPLCIMPAVALWLADAHPPAVSGWLLLLQPPPLQVPACGDASACCCAPCRICARHWVFPKGVTKRQYQISCIQVAVPLHLRVPPGPTLRLDLARS